MGDIKKFGKKNEKNLKKKWAKKRNFIVFLNNFFNFFSLTNSSPKHEKTFLKWFLHVLEQKEKISLFWKNNFFDPRKNFHAQKQVKIFRNPVLFGKKPKKSPPSKKIKECLCRYFFSKGFFFSKF